MLSNPLTDERLTVHDSPLYRSLFQTVERIVYNPPLPGNRRALCRCTQCIDDFYYQARITAEQWEALETLLMDAIA